MTARDTPIRLTHPDEPEPPSRRFEVAVSPIVDRSLDQVTEDAGEQVRPARLCGGSDTCLAIVEVG
ncbi:hypothetical protein [Actinoplanes regularis]|uniref:Uncharacterized protein n=1 Tax=Actinoplanes regularis TaxID=52697 RepID=A0A239DPY6_9ACTN|nr:hypothetical protein [Actinoplanes regularis]GIE89065.1 hypothetical protein Are01nite_55450 [Actinoplanes regularis]SNS34397.1 hypothetical protein SAMN06264365_11435 [Actinoplanes regularis]